MKPQPPLLIDSGHVSQSSWRERAPWVRAAVICTVALAMTAATFVPAQSSGPYPPLSRALVVEQVPGKPIYYVVGQPGVPGADNEGHTSNAGFVVTTDGVVVFDALGTPSLGWALLQEIRSITRQPVRYVVVSHYHADHIYGLQAFQDHNSGIIVAQERTSEYRENEETSGERADQRLAQRREALSPWVDERTRVVVPDVTFRQRATLSLGDRRFLLTYAGPAHSASDLMMFVEPDGVLFAGDIVQNGRIGFMNSDDVDTSNWLRALGEVETLNPKFVIPGHGLASTAAKEAVVFTRDYIEFVRAAMGKAVETWTSFEDAYARTDWSNYRGMPAFGPNNRGNAYRVFLEMERSHFKDEDPQTK
jgi:glyoxylase-like metal-dependent hydrolase (beta-lactamase superfamily II)